MSKFGSFLRPLVLKLDRRFLIRKSQGNPHSKRSLCRLSHLSPVAFISWFLTTVTVSMNEHFNAEKQISEMILQAEEYIKAENLTEAKKIIDTAFKLADKNLAFGSLSHLVDLLSTVLLNEGDIVEAEYVLVKFIEKCLQLGYAESHNGIVKCKLKLARIYQVLGSQEMAEYGFKDCIMIQENKIAKMKKLDEESNLIYLTVLFWYARLLADQKEYSRARKEYAKCLDCISKSSNVLPSQKMVVLHSIASVSAILNDYDAAINYLFDAIDLCLREDPKNQDLPVYLVQVGLLYLYKGIYEGALFWCQTGLSLASREGHKLAKEEGQKCIQELQKLKILK